MDRRTFKLENGDLAFDIDRNIIFGIGNDEITQALERAFTTNAGEWFLNANHGLEYPQIQGKKGLRDEVVQMSVIRCALQDARVQEIISIDIRRDIVQRTMDIKFLCKIDSGAVITVPFSFE